MNEGLGPKSEPLIGSDAMTTSDAVPQCPLR